MLKVMALCVILVAMIACLGFLLAFGKQLLDEIQEPAPQEKPQKTWPDITLRDLRSYCAPIRGYCESCPVSYLCASIFRVKPDDWILVFEGYDGETENTRKLLKAINSKRDWGPDPIATWLLEACQRIVDRGPPKDDE